MLRRFIEFKESAGSALETVHALKIELIYGATDLLEASEQIRENNLKCGKMKVMEVSM